MSLPRSLPHRRSMRLAEFDYSQAGAYFVTIVAQDRKPLFGQIADGEMVLNEAGEMVEKVWAEIPEHFPNVELSEFVVMPNHIHGIIIITVEATHASPQRGVPAKSRWVQSQVHLERLLAPSNQQQQKGCMDSPNIKRDAFGNGIIMNM